MIVEKCVVEPRHVEIQILGDEHGNLVFLGERECSVQNLRHQKLIEEAPCAVLDEDTRRRMGEAAVAAARTLGADFAYIGSAFLASDEASCGQDHKEAVVAAAAADIINTAAFSGTPANYLRCSIERAGFDPGALSQDRRAINVAVQDSAAKTWTDIWGCGQGIGSVQAIEPAAAIIDRIVHEYRAVMAGRGKHEF